MSELLYAIAKERGVLHRVWVDRPGPMPIWINPALAHRTALCGFRIGKQWHRIYVMEPGQLRLCRRCIEREERL